MTLHNIQTQSVPSELVMKLFGSLSAITFSPIVTIEPRRRKFHCPIKLKIPLPAGYRPETSGNLRLLCSITGGQSKAIWEDVTGSTPLSLHDKCLLFTTTVSARFWLVHCQRAQRCPDVARFAQELWRFLIQVPFMAKFVLFAKRRDINEANVRCFCMTDDKEEKTLEVQEHYTLVARSRDVEVLDGQPLYLEFGGNLLPTHLVASGRTSSKALINEQLAFAFFAFQENRLAFGVRLREVGQEPTGRIAFMEDSLKYLASLNSQQRAHLAERKRRTICTLGVQLPAMCVHYDNILGTPKRNSYYASSRIGDLTLADLAAELNEPPRSQSSARLELDSLSGRESANERAASVLSLGSQLSYSTQRKLPDWMELAPKLGIPRDEVEFIAEHCATSGPANHQTAATAPALLLLMHWFRLSSPDDRDQDLARGLVAIGREDIARRLNFPIEPKRISRSTAELLREIELIPVRSSENLYTGSELSANYGQRGASLRRLDQTTQADGSERRRAGSMSSKDEPASGDYFSPRKVPAIEINDQLQQPASKRNKIMDTQTSEQQVTTSASVASAPPTGGDAGSGATFPRQGQQQLAVLEQMASDLVESSLNEALEAHLRAQLHATADETMRAAFAAATGGGPHSTSYEREFVSEKTTFIESSQPGKKQRRRRGDIEQSLGSPRGVARELRAPAYSAAYIVALSSESLAAERRTPPSARAEVPSCARGAAPLGAPDPNLRALFCCAARRRRRRRQRDVNVTLTSAQTQFNERTRIESSKGWQKCSTACQTSADLNSRPAETREGWSERARSLKFKDTRRRRWGVAAVGVDTICPLACLGRGDDDDDDDDEQQQTCHTVTDVDQLMAAPCEPKLAADQKAEVTNGLSSGDDNDDDDDDDELEEVRNLIRITPVMQSEWLFCDQKEEPPRGQEVGDGIGDLEKAIERQACGGQKSSTTADIEIVCARARACAIREGALICAKRKRHCANSLEALGASAQTNCAIGARAYAITTTAATTTTSTSRERKQQQQQRQVDCHKILSARQSISEAGAEKWRLELKGSRESIHFCVTRRRKSAPTIANNIPVLISATPTSVESRSQVRRCESVRRRGPSRGRAIREARIRFCESLNLEAILPAPSQVTRSLKSLIPRRRPSTSSTPSAASLYLTAHDSSQLSTSQSFHNCKSTLATTTSDDDDDDDDDEYLTPVSERKLALEAHEHDDEDNLKTPTNEMVSLVNLETEEPVGVPEVPVGVVESSIEERRPSTSGDQQQLKPRKSRQVTSGGCEDDVIMASAIEQELAMEDTIDEEQVKRILACKRLSEGCNRFVGGGQVNGSNYICRKNSLHMQDSSLIMGGALPPVTEGEPMRHMSHHLSQNLESTSSSGSISSASFGLRSCGGGGGGINRHAPSKRNSQDDNATSCSSSTSLDGSGGGLRSPSRRRSSTVSQCSSVLSEGTRQQLNFDLSPDLAPDSSILDANALSPTGDSDGRPASPEPIESPVSLSGGCSPFDLRAISRMSSQCCDDLACPRSISTPDSTLGGHSNDATQPVQPTKSPIDQDDGNANDAANSETSVNEAAAAATISENLERIISHVSAVKVSSEQPEVTQQLSGSQKRAHTPFGANLQRNKASHVSPATPSPTGASQHH